MSSKITVIRWIKIMQDLSKKRYCTMSHYADEFKVSRRTIQRDVDCMSNVFPIYTERGRKNGGIYLDKDYHIQRVYMSDKDIELLNKMKVISSKKLTDEENMLVDRIISIYTMPCGSEFNRAV